MNEEKQAERLARWLDSPESEEPLDDLDDDVVEAITALRPDLAPGPRLTADDILASLTAGPLAQPRLATGENGSLATGEIRSLAPGEIGAPEPANRPMAARRWWTASGGAGGIGLALAAAAALFLVVRADLAPTTPEAALQEAAAPAAPDERAAEDANAPADLPAAGGDDPEIPIGGLGNVIDGVVTAAPPPEAKQSPALQDLVAGAAPVADGNAKGEASIAPVEPLPPATVSRSLSPVLDDAVVDAEDAAEEDADLGLTGRETTKDDQVRYEKPQLAPDRVATQASGPPAQAPAASAPMAPSPPAGDVAEGGSAGYGQQVTTTQASDETQRSAPKPKKSAGKGAESRAGASAPAAAAPEAEPPPPPPPPPADLSSGAAAGWAAGLDGQTIARFDAARSRAAGLAAAGDYAGAATVLGGVVGAPARAGQHHAAIAARYWLQAGARDRAAAVVRQGLALSSADTPERRDLLALLQAIEGATR